MYHAKNAGRNRFQLDDTTMNAMAEERLQPETDLHYAKARGDIVEVGQTLLHAACRQTAPWHAAGFTDLSVAVNLWVWSSGMNVCCRASARRSTNPACRRTRCSSN